VKVEVGLKFEITFLTQHLGFVHILPKYLFIYSFILFFIADLIQNYQYREVRQGVQTNKQTKVPNRK